MVLCGQAHLRNSSVADGRSLRKETVGVDVNGRRQDVSKQDVLKRLAGAFETSHLPSKTDATDVRNG